MWSVLFVVHNLDYMLIYVVNAFLKLIPPSSLPGPLHWVLQVPSIPFCTTALDLNDDIYDNDDDGGVTNLVLIRAEFGIWRQ